MLSSSVNLYNSLLVGVFFLSLGFLSQGNEICDQGAGNNTAFSRYFQGMKNIYRQTGLDGTCLPVHEQCGWPKIGHKKRKDGEKLPLFVFSIGLEGAGHHLWTEILQKPVFDCVWINGRHYFRDLSDGVPRTTYDQAVNGFKESFRMRLDTGQAPCRTIYDSEDSFPTGAIRKSGRVFMRPDLIHLQAMDGVVFNLKYLIITRNVTDTALSALRRNFFSHVAQELRTVEHTLTYIESAIRGISCHQIFVANYEHVLAEPRAFIEPLAHFLELEETEKTLLRQRLTKPGKLPSRKPHKLDQFEECKTAGLTGIACYQQIHNLVNEFMERRAFMWPTFAGNGFDLY